MHYDAEYIKHMMNDIIELPEDTQKLDMNSSKVPKQILTYYNPTVLYLIGHQSKLILL